MNTPTYKAYVRTLEASKRNGKFSVSLFLMILSQELQQIETDTKAIKTR